jgi:hypothetical protein
MIRKAFDEISFNDEGNEITLVKFLWRDAGDDNE